MTPRRFPHRKDVEIYIPLPLGKNVTDKLRVFENHLEWLYPYIFNLHLKILFSSYSFILIWPTDTLVSPVYSRMIWLFAVMRSTKVCIRCVSFAALIQLDSSRFVMIMRLRSSLRKLTAR